MRGASNYRTQKQNQHAFANVSLCRVYLKTERERERERRSPNSAKDDFNAGGGVRRGSIASNYGNAQKPIPACSAVYLFADGPGEPPCISHVDSWPGRPRGSSARPGPNTGNRRTYAHRISFLTAYKIISRDMREERFKEIILFFSDKKSHRRG